MLKPEDCRPGVVVECFRAWEPEHAGEVGRLFTIAAFRAETNRMGVLITGIWFEELPGWWCLWSFRLLPDERLDVFRAMLAPVPQEEECCCG